MDEDNHEVLSRSEVEALVNQHDMEQVSPNDILQPDVTSRDEVASTTEPDVQEISTKEHIAKIGASSKRRLAKAVGEEERPTQQQEVTLEDTTKKSKVRKGKRIKLSFDEDDQQASEGTTITRKTDSGSAQ